jgi:ParB-like chromosome segregation protein Spo0J
VNSHLLSRTSIKRIPLSDIHIQPDGPYCTSFGFDSAALKTSLDRIGLANPPVLTEEGGEGGWRVVCGYRRLMCVRELNWSHVSARIFSKGVLSHADALLLNLYENLAFRGFNDVEKAMILSRCCRWMSRESVLNRVMPLLELPSRNRTLELYLRLEGISDPVIKEGVAGGQLSLKAVEILAHLEAPDAHMVAKTAIKLNLNMNQQRQLIEYLEDLSGIFDQDFSEILASSRLQSVLEDARLNPPQKAKAFMGALRALRLPTLTEAEQSFRRAVRKLELPSQTRIEAPPAFESPFFRLEIRFRDGPELAEKIHRLEGRAARISQLRPVA